MRFTLDHPVLALTLLGLLLLLLGQPVAGGDFYSAWGSRLTSIGGTLAILPVGASYALSHVLDAAAWQMVIGTALGLAVAAGLEALLRGWRARRR
jgi:hypothetical protein